MKPMPGHQLCLQVLCAHTRTGLWSPSAHTCLHTLTLKVDRGLTVCATHPFGLNPYTALSCRFPTLRRTLYTIPYTVSGKARKRFC